MKTFLSIGSGPGVSLATAARFAREGYQIALSSRNPAGIQPLADHLEAQGRRVEVRSVDCADPRSVAALIAGVEEQFGPIEVLHYNAAAIRKATLAEQPPDTFDKDLAVNVGSAFVATQALVQRMGARGSGTILLTGGGYAIAPNPQYLSLSIGKAAIRALALGTFEGLKQQGIHIATVTIGHNIDPQSGQAEAIADLFWQLHSQPLGQWTAELRF